MKKEEIKNHSVSGDNSFGVAAVVIGILSIVFASVNGIIFGIIGLAFSLKQKKSKKNPWSKWGAILSIIGIILSIVLIILLYLGFAPNFSQQI